MKLYFVFFLFLFPCLFADPCKIFLIRHGETEWNVAGKSQGWKDIPLNETGKAQAREMAEELSRLKVHVIYTSSLSRAEETADIIAEKLSIPQKVSDPALRFYGKKKRWKWLKTKKRKEFEMQREITADATLYFKHLSAMHPGEIVLVVTHQAVIKSLYKTIGPHIKKTKKVGNGRMMCLVGTEDSLTVKEVDL